MNSLTAGCRFWKTLFLPAGNPVNEVNTMKVSDILAYYEPKREEQDNFLQQVLHTLHCMKANLPLALLTVEWHTK